MERLRWALGDVAAGGLKYDPEMTDQPANGQTLEFGALPQRRGRPPGAQNKRSTDLARYIAASYGGMTPGQQSAAVALVSPDEVEAAPEDAKQLRIVDLGLDAVTLALAVKAHRLAKALGCAAFEAWAILAREREGLMKYVHQPLPPAKEDAGGRLATVYLVPEGKPVDSLAFGALPGEEQDPDFLELFPDDVGDAPSAMPPAGEET